MEARYLRYDEKTFNNMVQYYLGKPGIYEFCYKNSIEFREFIDNANDEIKESISKMHRCYRLSRMQEPFFHMMTFGISYIFKKIAQKREFDRLREIIDSDEFKSFFKNFNNIALRIEMEKMYPEMKDYNF